MPTPEARIAALSPWARQILEEVAARHDITLTELCSGSRSHEISRARSEAAYRLREYVNPNTHHRTSLKRIASWLGITLQGAAQAVKRGTPAGGSTAPRGTVQETLTVS